MFHYLQCMSFNTNWKYLLFNDGDDGILQHAWFIARKSDNGGGDKEGHCSKPEVISSSRQLSEC